MATPTWPATLPQLPLSDGWDWKPQSNRAVFTPEVGPEIVRRRTSAAVTTYRAKFPEINATQVATFETWYDDTLYSGALHYLWNDPVSGSSAKWRITEYHIRHLSAGWYELSLNLQKIPGAAV